MKNNQQNLRELEDYQPIDKYEETLPGQDRKKQLLLDYSQKMFT